MPQPLGMADCLMTVATHTDQLPALPAVHVGVVVRQCKLWELVKVLDMMHNDCSGILAAPLALLALVPIRRQYLPTFAPPIGSIIKSIVIHCLPSSLHIYGTVGKANKTNNFHVDCVVYRLLILLLGHKKTAHHDIMIDCYILLIFNPLRDQERARPMRQRLRRPAPWFDAWRAV